MTHYVLLCRHAPHEAHTLTRKHQDKERPGPFPTEAVADVLREHLLWQPSPGPAGGRMLLRGVLFADTPEARQTLALLGRGLAGEPRWKGEAPPWTSSNRETLRLYGEVGSKPEEFEAKPCKALVPKRGLRGGRHRCLVRVACLVFEEPRGRRAWCRDDRKVP